MDFVASIGPKSVLDLKTTLFLKSCVCMGKNALYFKQSISSAKSIWILFLSNMQLFENIRN